VKDEEINRVAGLDEVRLDRTLSIPRDLEGFDERALGEDDYRPSPFAEAVADTLTDPPEEFSEPGSPLYSCTVIKSVSQTITKEGSG